MRFVGKVRSHVDKFSLEDFYRDGVGSWNLDILCVNLAAALDSITVCQLFKTLLQCAPNYSSST